MHCFEKYVLSYLSAHLAAWCIDIGSCIRTQSMVVGFRLGGYTACGIPLIRSANGNGNGIPFPLRFFLLPPLIVGSVKAAWRGIVNLCRH